jgi:predicted HTH domain antitoxin
MGITFDLPQDVEQSLRESLGDLSEAAKEAFLVQSYQEGRLSVGQVAAVLGRGVIESQAWLAEKGAPLNYSPEELEEDRKTFAKLSNERGR